MIFVDSWAWIALADKDDPYHRKAKAQHEKLTGLASSMSRRITS